MYTLKCLVMLARPKEKVIIEELIELIKDKIVPLLDLCESPDIEHGTAGFLQALLTIEQ